MIREWMFENEVYSYYLKLLYPYVKEEKGFTYSCCGDSIQLFYSDYLVAEFFVKGKRIFLRPFTHQNMDYVSAKLRHEYDKRFFDINIHKKYKSFPLKEINMLYFWEYLDVVREKIDKGFEKYVDLFGKGNIESIGYLNINIDNAFSLQTLPELIALYNELYEVVFDILRQANSNMINDEYFTPVIESIHMASKGDIVVAGIKTVLAIVDELISGLLDLSLSYEEYEIKRQRLENERQVAQAAPEVMRAISDLIIELDRISGVYRNTQDEHVKYFSRQHISDLRERIFILQGGTHFNYFV